MKAIQITTVASVAQAVPSLMNLRNATLLNSDSNTKVSPLESIAHIATFDEIPIFGGEELRSKMLSAASKIDTDFFTLEGLTNAAKKLGCTLQFSFQTTMNFVKGSEKL